MKKYKNITRLVFYFMGYLYIWYLLRWLMMKIKYMFLVHV